MQLTTESVISVNENMRLKDYFDRSLVMGIECERAIPREHNIVAANLETEYLALSGSKGDNCLAVYKRACANRYNVAFVTSDGSIPFGNEIIFNGTTEKYDWIYHKLFLLETKLDKLNCEQWSSTTSNHQTFITLQDKLIDTLVIKNIWQISRVFQSGLYFLGGANPSTHHRTQMYCPHIVDITPMNKTFSEFRPGTRGMLNLNRQQIINIANKEYCHGMRLEFRHIDGMRVPSAITALLYLHRAIIYKAIDLSLKGLLDVTSAKDWRKNKYVSKIIGSRPLLDSERQTCYENAKSLIEFVRPILKTMSPESLSVLELLADKPISERRGKWSDIDKQIRCKIRCELTKNEQEFLKTVILEEIKADTAAKWKTKLARKHNVTERSVEYWMTKTEIKTGKKIIFDAELRSYKVI